MKSYPRIAMNVLERLRSRYDGYLVGYPKVGNTWMQVMLRQALVTHFDLGPREASKVLGPRHRIPKPVPAINVTHLMPGFNQESHRTMRLRLRGLYGRPVVVLIRNPGDTLVSLYFHKSVRKTIAAARPMFSGDADALVRSEQYGIEKYIAFYRQLHADRDRYGSYDVIAYEEMTADPSAALRKALDAYGLGNVSDECIRAAVDFGSFDNMRRLEDTDALGIAALKPYASDVPDARKVREGKTGSFRSRLSRESIELIEERTRDSLPPELRKGFDAAMA